ncbi:MAG TPA: DNA-binding response regulator, partial [Ruthenibacterium lactatiformans]|nr:DNA-binding response regulator [Ruthenibacterium lactatiformans]
VEKPLDLSEITAALREVTAELLRHAQPTEEELFFHGGHSPERPMNQTVFSCGKSALSQLEKLIRSNRGEETLAALGRMYAEISRCEGTSPEYLRHLYCQIIFLFLHAAESHNVRAVTERTDFLLYTAVRQETLAGLWDILRRTAQDYFSALNPSCPDIAVRVENYIEAHYRNCGLTVQSIAGELGFTNSYLCAAYKKSCGKTVNQRLTEIRLHHAKELLAGTSRRLYEIANAVGYGDGKYFVKLFTREVGLSPREYRGRHSYEE